MDEIILAPDSAHSASYGLKLRGPGAFTQLENGECVTDYDHNMQLIDTTLAKIVSVLGTQIKTLQLTGGGDSSFFYAQNVASATWVVRHDLSKFPSVTVVDSSGQQVIGEVSHDSNNQCTLRFSAPFAGFAYFN